MLKTSAEGVEFVFTVMDLTIVLLIMIVTVIWFRSKYLERFYEACKVKTKGLPAEVFVDISTSERRPGDGVRVPGQ